MEPLYSLKSHMYTYVTLCMYMYMYVVMYMYVILCMYMYMYVVMYMYVILCMYMYMYVVTSCTQLVSTNYKPDYVGTLNWHIQLLRLCGVIWNSLIIFKWI